MSSNLPQQLAKHLRDLHFGGNWTSVNLRQTLSDVTWQQATVKAGSFNTIATLVYHIHYYIAAVSNVLQGGLLLAKDEFSFDHPPVESKAGWETFLDNVWGVAETFANLIEQLPEDRLWEDFTDKKYGTYYRNLQGIIEHSHYHLGQIVLIKKMLTEQEPIPVRLPAQAPASQS